MKLAEISIKRPTLVVVLLPRRHRPADRPGPARLRRARPPRRHRGDDARGGALRRRRGLEGRGLAEPGRGEHRAGHGLGLDERPGLGALLDHRFFAVGDTDDKFQTGGVSQCLGQRFSALQGGGKCDNANQIVQNTGVGYRCGASHIPCAQSFGMTPSFQPCGFTLPRSRY